MNNASNGMSAAELAGARWVKSSRSGPTGGNCVEVARLADGQVAMRNSRYPSGPALVFTAPEWDAFVDGAKDGEFGLQARRAEHRRAGQSDGLPRISREPVVSLPPAGIARRLQSSAARPRVGGQVRPLPDYRRGRSNSPFLAPAKNAAHSVRVYT